METDEWTEHVACTRAPHICTHGRTRKPRAHAHRRTNHARRWARVPHAWPTAPGEVVGTHTQGERDGETRRAETCRDVQRRAEIHREKERKRDPRTLTCMHLCVPRVGRSRVPSHVLTCCADVTGAGRAGGWELQARRRGRPCTRGSFERRKRHQGWLCVVAVDGLQRLIRMPAEHASSTGEACCFDAVANDHAAGGPGRRWTSVHVRTGAVGEEVAVGALPISMTLDPEVRPPHAAG